MKRHVLLIALLAFVAINVSAQRKFNVYAVGFYNVENLFDTQHDVGKNDYEYLPDGANKWNDLKYNRKLHNMARALADMGTDMLPGVGCAMIGISEVENANALTDLCAQPELAARGYQFAHIEGPDRRGVDCAFLYNPSLFTLRDVKLVQYVQELEADSAYKTRGFLTVTGYLAGDLVGVIVCHWPSRASGSFYRESGGRQVKVVKDSLLALYPNMKVMVMGDMNDDPQNKSMSVELRAKKKMKDVKEGDMFNPWWSILDSGTGTLSYQGSWNLFDQIVMTPNMLDIHGTKDYTSLTYLKCQIQRFDYLINKEGKYKGTPKRTTAAGEWLDGYSDHLPVAVYLVKDAEMVKKDMENIKNVMSSANLSEIDFDAMEAELSKIVAKARAEGENWSEDEWKIQFANAVSTVKPMLMKFVNLQETIGNSNGEDVDIAAFTKLMEDFQSHEEQLSRIEQLMEEFGDIADNTENGKKVQEDKSLEDYLIKELGIEGLEEMLNGEESQDVDMDDEVEDDHVHPIE